MTLPTDAETALLGLLCEEDMHPWQIEKTVQWRDMRSWTDLSQSTIYKQLRSLEGAGRVECHPEVEGGRLRKVYRITPQGREDLAARLQEILGEAEHQKWRVDLATYNLDLLPPGAAREALAAYRRALEDRIRCYRELEAFLVAEECPTHRLAVARRPIHLLEGELRWLDAYAAELEG